MINNVALVFLLYFASPFKFIYTYGVCVKFFSFSFMLFVEVYTTLVVFLKGKHVVVIVHCEGNEKD